MFDELTVEDIKDNILSRLTTEIDTREGSFINDMISTVAYEIWKMYQALNAVFSIVFVDENSGEYLDRRCKEYGIIRKEGAKATTTLIFTGVDGTVIPKGKVFMTSDGLEFVTGREVIIIDGKAEVMATAVEPGEKYNVQAGTITRQSISLNGLTSVTNDEAKGGSNPETDEALVQRLHDLLQKPATSGNANQYRQWALEVPGVGDAKVFPLWNGPGTVKVIVVDSNKQPVPETIIQKVAEYIEAVRPIGAMVTVASGTPKVISISANIMLAVGYSLQNVITNFTKNISKYFGDITFNQSYASIAKIGTILLGTEGVIDYSDLLINDSNYNISLTDEEIPVLGIVNLEV